MAFRLITLTALSAFVLGGAAFAAEPAAVAASAAPVAEAPAFAVETPVEQAFSGAATDNELDANRGGTDGSYAAVTEQTLQATNSGNAVIAGTVTSGAINFSPSALAGFSGVGNFVLNTGNNNNLQGAITINILTPN